MSSDDSGVAIVLTVSLLYDCQSVLWNWKTMSIYCIFSFHLSVLCYRLYLVWWIKIISAWIV